METLNKFKTNTVQDTPPTNDPSLPNYQVPEYNTFIDNWEFLHDQWVGRDKWYKPSCGIVDDQKSNLYLPREAKEPTSAYKARLARSPYLRRLEPIIDGFAGLLAEYYLEDVPEGLEEYFNNIDLMGNSFQVFLKECDKMALRDGHCFVYVDYPVMQEEVTRSALDDQSDTRQPYLVLIDPRNVPNWSYDFVNGEMVIQHVTIKETIKVQNGDFGYEYKEVWRVLTPGAFAVFEIVRDTDTGNWVPQLIEQGVTSLSEVPFVYYSVSDLHPFTSFPPLLNLAELNLLHYQQSSDYYTVMHMCNLPVPVRKGAMELDGTIPELILGPNSPVDVPIDGDFAFVEPAGTAIEATRQSIIDIESKMDEMALSFLSGNQQEKTATEVSIQSAQTQSFLSTLADQKESAATTMLKLMGMYVNQQEVGKICINKDLLRPPITPEQVALCFKEGIISRETAVARLAELGIVEDPEEEVKKLDAEEEANIEKGQQMFMETAEAALNETNQPTGNQFNQGF